jgi:hypothetical protein
MESNVSNVEAKTSLKFIVWSCASLSGLEHSLNNPPPGYELHSWSSEGGAVKSYYTVVYKRTTDMLGFLETVSKAISSDSHHI